MTKMAADQSSAHDDAAPGDRAGGRPRHPPPEFALPAFAYLRPRSLAEATAALARPGAHAYAGGTDLLLWIAERAPTIGAVRLLVDIKDLTAASGIRSRPGWLRIGALTTMAELAGSAVVRRHAPMLAEAAAHTAAPALRHRATLGGNLVTRHPAPDAATALLAASARVEWIGREGRRRRTPVGDFIAAPPRRSRLVLAIHVPASRRSAFEKHGSRRGFSRSIVAVAVRRSPKGSGVAIGGVGVRPIVAVTAARALDRASCLATALATDGVPAAKLELATTLLVRASNRVPAR